MAENSKIEWTHHTFNPWEGCTKVSAGCANCYAETRAERFGTVKWGPQGTRRVASENYWRQPLKWDREAREAGERRRVFCASLADVFEDWQGPMTCSKTGEPLSVNAAGHVWPMGWPSLSDGDDWGARDYTMNDARRRLFDLIDRTHNLDWLLLTKRPENILRMMPPRDLGEPDQADVASGMDPESPWRRPNVWVGASVEDQATADERIPHLLRVPAAVRFLSVEPLLAPVGLRAYLQHEPFHEHYKMTFGLREWRGVDWVIVGGESGHGARPCSVEWVRSLVRQCQAAKVPCFVKQLGARPEKFAAYPYPQDGLPEAVGEVLSLRLRDPKGGDPAEWPEDLRIRQFPEVRQ